MGAKRTTALIFVICLAWLVLGCGGGGSTTADPTPQPEPVVQNLVSPDSGDMTFTVQDANLKVETAVRDGGGRPVSGVNVKMIATDTVVVLSASDPDAEYYPVVKVIPKSTGHTVSQDDFYLRVDAYLVLSEVGDGVAGISFNQDPPVLNLPGIAPGKTTVMGGVQLAAREVIPLGGVITLKLQLENLDWKLINLHFGKAWTEENIVAELANYLDITRDYDISTHPEFPRYVEIEAGKTGDVHDTAPGIEYEILANGETATGDVGDITVTNNSDLQYRLVIVPGTTMENSNQDHQDLTVIDTTVVIVDPGETKSAPVFGACVHRHKAGPQEGDILSPFREQRRDLVAVCIVIDQTDIPLGIGQDAIWVITDDHPPKPNNLEKVRQVFLAAGLDPDDYEPLRYHDGGGGGDL